MEALDLVVGAIGYGITRTLVESLLRVPRFEGASTVRVRLKSLCGRNREAVEAAARQLGFERSTPKWEEVATDPEINLLINGAPNHLHAAPSVRALAKDKHVLCEKPMGLGIDEARAMAAAARTSSGCSMVGFNYRFVPAVRLARSLIEEGRLGRIYQSRFVFHDEVFASPAAPFNWLMDRSLSGRGVLGDLGSHAIDLALFLLPELPTAVCGLERILVDLRQGRRVNAPDMVSATLQYRDGSLAAIDASSSHTGSKNALGFEIVGELGALRWSLERLNELDACFVSDRSKRSAGFRVIRPDRRDHEDLVPWVADYPIGLDATYLLEMLHLVRTIRSGAPIEPPGAGFPDGLRVEIVMAGIEESSRRRGASVSLVY